MTKTKIGCEETKVPMPDQAVAVQGVEQFNTRQTTCWYVCGILSTIFCCFPCGVIGLVHAMIAGHEAEKGNYDTHRRRLYQAKCWISWSIAIMVTLLLASFIYWGVQLGWFEKSYRLMCGIDSWYDYEDYAHLKSNETTEWMFEEKCHRLRRYPTNCWTRPRLCSIH